MAAPWCDEKCRPIDWWFAGRRANLQGNVFWLSALLHVLLD